MNLSKYGQEAQINGDIITIGTSEDQSLIIDCLNELNPDRFSWVGISVVNSDVIEFRSANGYNRWRIKTEFENGIIKNTGIKIPILDQTHFWKIGGTEAVILETDPVYNSEKPTLQPKITTNLNLSVGVITNGDTVEQTLSKLAGNHQALLDIETSQIIVGNGTSPTIPVANVSNYKKVYLFNVDGNLSTSIILADGTTIDKVEKGNYLQIVKTNNGYGYILLDSQDNIKLNTTTNTGILTLAQEQSLAIGISKNQNTGEIWYKNPDGTVEKITNKQYKIDLNPNNKIIDGIDGLLVDLSQIEADIDTNSQSISNFNNNLSSKEDLANKEQVLIPSTTNYPSSNAVINALNLKQDKTSVATISRRFIGFAQRININDQGQNNDLVFDDFFSTPTPKDGAGRIILPTAVSIRYGTTSPSLVTGDKTGDRYFRTKSGTSATQPYEEYTFNAGAWYRTDAQDNFNTTSLNFAPNGIVPAGATSYSDFDGDWSATVTLPSAVGRKNEIFTYNHNASLHPTILGTNKYPATAIVITGSVKSLQFISDGANWVQVATMPLQEEVVNVSGITFPITFPTTTLTGTPVFTPNLPATQGIVYELTDGATIQFAKWNGTQYISSLAPISQLGNVRYGTTAPTVLATDKKNDTYIQSSSGGFGGTITDTLVFDGTNWVSQNVVKSGNVTAFVSNALPTTVLNIGGLYEISMAASTDVRIRSFVNRQAYILSEGEYPGGSFSTSTAAIVNLTTAFVPADNNVHVAGERNIITVQDVTTNRVFRITVWRFGAIAGNWTGWVEEIGITTNQILTAGNGIAITSGVISDPNVISRNSPIANAIAGTQSILGEFEFRYNRNDSLAEGNLEIRSSDASTKSIIYNSEELYLATPRTVFGVNAPLTINANTGAFTVLNAGGSGLNQDLRYYIKTLTNAYKVDVFNFNNQSITLRVEKTI